MKKSFLLLSTLVIPATVFIFLKFFGTNTFEVPYLFEEGIPDCPNSTSPHRVPDFEYIGETEKNMTSKAFDGFMIYAVLNGSDLEKNKELLVELVRIQDAFFEVGAPDFFLLINGNKDRVQELKQLCIESGLGKENSTLAIMANNKLMDFLKCGIALSNEKTTDFSNLVLVDPDRRIRGIYHSNDVEQTDQLILELKILRQKF